MSGWLRVLLQGVDLLGKAKDLVAVEFHDDREHPEQIRNAVAGRCHACGERICGFCTFSPELACRILGELLPSLIPKDLIERHRRNVSDGNGGV